MRREASRFSRTLHNTTTRCLQPWCLFKTNTNNPTPPSHFNPRTYQSRINARSSHVYLQKRPGFSCNPLRFSFRESFFQPEANQERKNVQRIIQRKSIALETDVLQPIALKVKVDLQMKEKISTSGRARSIENTNERKSNRLGPQFHLRFSRRLTRETIRRSPPSGLSCRLVRGHAV